MKKTCNLILLAMTSVLMLLSSCGDNSENKGTPSEKAKYLQNEIMKCFENEDKETLKSFFCENTTDNYDLDSQIDEAFAFIDGKIVSYDEPFAGACGSFDRKSYGADTNNIITDKNRTFKISFSGWLTNEKDTEKVGVFSIKVIDMAEPYDKNKTDYENGIRYIGEESLLI
jgi:hypothetical protein